MNSSLYVSNLPFTFDQKEFRRLFAAYGDVERIDIPDQHGSSKTIAYVHFYDEKSAMRAIDGLDGTDFFGRKLSVQISRKPKKIHQPIQRMMSDSSEQYRDNSPGIVRPRPPVQTQFLNFKDSEQYMSLPCKMIPINTSTASMIPQNGSMPLNITMPSFSQDGQTFGMTTTIKHGDMMQDALVFLMPLPRNDQPMDYQMYQGMQSQMQMMPQQQGPPQHMYNNNNYNSYNYNPYAQTPANQTPYPLAPSRQQQQQQASQSMSSLDNNTVPSSKNVSDAGIPIPEWLLS